MRRALRWVGVTMFLLGVAAAGGQTSAPAPSVGSVRVSLGFDGLDLVAENAPLADVLAAVSGELGIVVETSRPLEHRIDLTLTAATVRETIAALLGSSSYLLAYGDVWTGPVGDSPNRLRVFSHVADSRGREARPRGHADAPDGPLEEADLDDAVFSILLDEDAGTVVELIEAARDPDPRVRATAVSGLAHRRGAGVAQTLLLAIADSEPAVREEAIYALSDRADDNARSVIQAALGDPDAGVRSAARDVLDDVHRE